MKRILYDTKDSSGRDSRFADASVWLALSMGFGDLEDAGHAADAFLALPSQGKV